MVISDFLVIGGGIIGLSIARELKKRYPESRIIVLEKEDKCGLHASGRNSGVLHAGFYYTTDSFKARFTRIGNQQLTEFCNSNKIPLNNCGKLVVAEKPEDIPKLDELLLRGKNNNVNIHSITEKEAKEIEPRVKTLDRALFSPTTSSVDPSKVMQALSQEVLDLGIQIHHGTRFIKKNDQAVQTTKGNYESKYIINVGGLYADKIAKQFGFSNDYCILPFKGLYLYSKEPPGNLKTHIYPVPDLKNPFLGVHFTVMANGMSKIGPTAIPAFWREQYTGINNFHLNEFLELSLCQAKLFFNSSFDFKQLAWREIRKYSRAHLVNLASTLLQDVKISNFKDWGKPGIRAQLLNIKNNTLEMDFIIEGDHQSIHVLNAVSPAFTCAFPFADHICNKIEQLTK
ncbi:MAG: L-2-hydroxyglutarate oxidase [Nitrosomonadaceae bacterium]|nr:L-2-hydroxyglutarate oxidase [Nitrosomonadaceae bacterium]|tara:strand:+ start:660 stop:1859 length:1200 start_codon:yes stop_codon:yes gene_type:complete